MGRTENVESAKAAIEERQKAEAAGEGYGVYDSSLLNGVGEGVSFENSFGVLVPEDLRLNLKEYIESELGLKKGSAIGIELGGPGKRLFEGFSQGFFKKSLGVSLFNEETRGNPAKTAEVNSQRHHYVLSGNIFSPQTQADVNNWLEGKKADLIIERMFGATGLMPNDVSFLGQQLGVWYKMLENRGLMFLQLPYPKFKQKLIEAWVEKINREYHKKIEISLNMEREVMSLKKHPGAPEDFPQFAPMELL